jgi:hypothetical protein
MLKHVHSKTCANDCALSWGRMSRENHMLALILSRSSGFELCLCEAPQQYRCLVLLHN